MKKLMAFVLALLCVLNLVGCGTVDTDRDNGNKLNSKETVMKEITEFYKEELGLANESCVLGDQLSAYRLLDGKLEEIPYEVYPVLAGGKDVACADIHLSDTGEWLSVGGAESAEDFWQEYSKHPGIAFAIVYTQEGEYFVREGEPPVLLLEGHGNEFDSIQELDKHLASLVYKDI